MPKVPRKPSPELLESPDPEVGTVPAGSVLWRIYFRGGLHPVSWKDFRYVGPVDARFAHHVGHESTTQDLAVVYGAEDPTTCLAGGFQKTRVMNRWHQDPWLVGFETLMADVLEWGHGLSVARERLRKLTERVPHPDWLFREAFPQLSDAQIELAAFYARAYPRRGRPRREPFWRGREPAAPSDTALDETPGSCPNGIAASTAPGYH